MDEVAGILVIVGLALLAMPVLLIVALVSLSSVKARVADPDPEDGRQPSDSEPLQGGDEVVQRGRPSQGTRDGRSLARR